MVAVEVLPVPPFLDDTLTLLVSTPAVVPVTFTFTVHEVPGAKDTPERVTELLPATADGLVEHVELRLFGVATTKPAGKLSVKAMPFRVLTEFGLVIVNVNPEVPFKGMLVGLNAFVIEGGLMTVSIAVEVFPVPAAV